MTTPHQDSVEQWNYNPNYKPVGHFRLHPQPLDDGDFTPADCIAVRDLHHHPSFDLRVLTIQEKPCSKHGRHQPQVALDIPVTPPKPGHCVPEQYSINKISQTFCFKEKSSYIYLCEESLSNKSKPGGFLRKCRFFCFLMGLFPPAHAFSEGFWQISLKRSLYVKNWRKLTVFFFILGLERSSPNSLGPPGTLWDPLGGIKVGVQQESCSE